MCVRGEGQATSAGSEQILKALINDRKSIAEPQNQLARNFLVPITKNIHGPCLLLQCLGGSIGRSWFRTRWKDNQPCRGESSGK